MIHQNREREDQGPRSGQGRGWSGRFCRRAEPWDRASSLSVWSGRPAQARDSLLPPGSGHGCGLGVAMKPLISSPQFCPRYQEATWGGRASEGHSIGARWAQSRRRVRQEPALPQSNFLVLALFSLLRVSSGEEKPHDKEQEIATRPRSGRLSKDPQIPADRSPAAPHFPKGVGARARSAVRRTMGTEASCLLRACPTQAWIVPCPAVPRRSAASEGVARTRSGQWGSGLTLQWSVLRGLGGG